MNDVLDQVGAGRDPPQLRSEPALPGVHRRLAVLLPGRTPFLGIAAADLRPDLELLDPSTRRRGQWEGGGPVEVIEQPGLAASIVPPLG